jgi:hypothetical protein
VAAGLVSGYPSSNIKQVRKDITMKTLSFILLLLASMAFVLLGCSDSSNPLAGPPDRAGIAPNPPASLAKGAAVVHSATGSGHTYVDGELRTFSFVAKELADGTYQGEWEAFSRNWGRVEGKWHGVVTFVKFDGNKALIVGRETSGSYAGWYDAFAVVDNGEGANGSRDMLTRTDSWATEAEAMAYIGPLTPGDYTQLHKDCCFREIAMGNIQVK